MTKTQDLPYIWIRKITRNTIEDEILKKCDITNIRRWHRNAQDAWIDGDICLVTKQNQCGFPAITIKINESFESLVTRLGNIDQLS